MKGDDDQDTVDQIAATEKVVGQILPVIVDATGKVVDGKHRMKANADWKKQTVQFKDKVTMLAARLVLNAARRSNVSDVYNQLAQELVEQEGLKHKSERTSRKYWTLKNEPCIISARIAKLTGLEPTSIDVHLKAEFKAKAPQYSDAEATHNDTSGIVESLELLRDAVIKEAGHVKKHPKAKRPLAEFIAESIAAQLTKQKLICPYCKKPAKSLVWGCCKHKFAEAD